MKLSVIILNHNTRDLLRQCLKTVNGSYQVIVVDNNSTDGSVEMVKENFPNVKIIPRKVNDGYTRGNNAAKNIATGEYVLFLNSDTEVYKKTLETMVDFMDKNSDVGISTCLVELPDKSLYYACHRGFPTPLNSLLYFLGLPSSYYPKYQNNIHEIDACSGTFLLVRRALLDEINWFDEDYFSFGEDIEMCYQIKKLGYKVMFNPTVKIMHYWGASSGLKSSSQDVAYKNDENKKKWNNARYDAMKIFYNKHYKNKYPIFVWWLVNLGIDLKKKISWLLE